MSNHLLFLLITCNLFIHCSDGRGGLSSIVPFIAAGASALITGTYFQQQRERDNQAHEKERHLLERYKSKGMLISIGRSRKICNPLNNYFNASLKEGDQEACQNVIRRMREHFDVNGIDSDGQTALHVAITSDNSDAIRFLLAHDADPNIPDSDEQTPLHHAASRGNVIALALLVAKHANIEAKDNKNKTPLHRAAAQGNIRAIHFFLEHQADIKSRDNQGKTPIMIALRHGHLEAARTLLFHRGPPRDDFFEKLASLLKEVKGLDEGEYKTACWQLLAPIVKERNEADCLICFDDIEQQCVWPCCAKVTCAACIEQYKATNNHHTMCPFCKAESSAIPIPSDIFIDREAPAPD